MKKSKIFILVALLFIIALFVLCFLIYNSLFPKAPPIEVPEPYQDMTWVTEYKGGIKFENDIDETTNTDDVPYTTLLAILKTAKPTRIMSVNDTPVVDQYMKVSFVCENKTYTYFMYESGGILYAEVPYVGVYKIV